jgi:carbamoyl-phosphate synthase large subunit
MNTLPLVIYHYIPFLLKKLLEQVQREVKRAQPDLAKLSQSEPDADDRAMDDSAIQPEIAPQTHKPIHLFVRQPLTESDDGQKAIIQNVLNLLGSFDGQPYPLKILTGQKAQSRKTFRHSFEQETGLDFTPSNFRTQRFKLIDHADAMIVVRTNLSESGAFEIAYNIFGGHKIPIFFAVWRQAPIKTTLLQDLDELCSVTYATFDHPEELILPFTQFLKESLRKKRTLC